MNRHYCEKEAQLIAAMRSGALRPELEKHASACDICSSIAAVSKFLQAQAAVRPVLPDADFLWWRAQLANKRLAMEQATRSIVLVRRIAYCGISAAALWLAFTPGHLGAILATLSGHEIRPSSTLGQTALVMGVGALVFTLLSSWYLARLEK
jgi:hypothetical protein